MTDSDTIKLTYTQLAERLGIKPHAARMKAKRAADRGLWRIIPGNHPNDRVLVELPASALTTRARAEGHSKPAQMSERELGHVHERADGNDTARDAVAALNTALIAAQIQITSLTYRLISEADARRREVGLLAATEAREMALEGEVFRLSNEAQQLAAQLDRARRPWWRR
jgi:hypothetical protein